MKRRKQKNSRDWVEQEKLVFFTVVVFSFTTHRKLNAKCDVAEAVRNNKLK